MFLFFSDGNMNEQELNEPQNRVALLKGEQRFVLLNFLHLDLVLFTKRRALSV